MGYFELVVGLLFVLALVDLSVGVSNDAVNFLNSARASTNSRPTTSSKYPIGGYPAV